MSHASLCRLTHYNVAQDGNELSFGFQIVFEDNSTTDFTETITVPIAITHPDDPCLQRILQSLHIGLAISYYKLYFPPKIEHPYKLSATAADFWNSVYRNGLGEFMYTNKLHANDLATFHGDAPATNVSQLPTNQSAILGIGGGKDSIVGFETLKNLQIPVSGFILGTGTHAGQAQEVADIMGVGVDHVERKLDPQLLALNNSPNTYNGHVPISMVFAFCGVLLAYLRNTAYVVVANEASASIPQAQWDGNAVNHQWSKSLEFEKLFQTYTEQEICTGITYFSIVRPLSSVAIAKLFARYPQYFETFTSDNGVFRVDPALRPNGRWSTTSPKSLSSFILLAPWIQDHDMQRIFGANLLDEQALSSLFLQLTGLEGHPPLDCVGTIDEMILSLNLLTQAHRYQSSCLMRLAHKHGFFSKTTRLTLDAALATSSDHAIPQRISEQIINSYQEIIKT
jgi:hypothetical protein